MVGLGRIRQVKLPVSDLAHSVAWYLSVLDLKLAAEFVEQDILRGAVLIDPDHGWVIALRDRAVCAGQPVLTGFDVFAIEVESVQDLRDLAARCERLGVAYQGVHDNGDRGAYLDVPDPDGTVVRFLANNPITGERFLGVETGDDGQLSFYETPRLLPRAEKTAG